MTSSENPVTSVEMLPPELLNTIFSLIHDDHKLETEVFQRGLSRPEIELVDEADDDGDYDTEVGKFLTQQKLQVTLSKSPSLFPYSLAAVCGSWKNVLSSSPAFWTRLVLFIDSPSTPMEDAREYLERSRQLPIDAFLLRRSEPRDSDLLNSQPEQQRVDDFIKLLKPHMGRCRSFHVDANLSSSLPPLADIIPSDARCLRSLNISCYFDFRTPKEEISDGPSPGLYVVTEARPYIQTMDLDARTFIRLCNSAPRWFAFQPQLRHLGIYRLNQTSALLALHRTLYTIDKQLNTTLLSLSFSNLDFDLDIKDTESDQFHFSRVQDLRLHDIKPDVMSELFRVCSFARLHLLHFMNCSGLDKRIFDDLQPQVPMVLAISTSTTVNSEIVDFLSNWMGMALYLSGTSTTYDHVADALSRPAPDETNLDTVDLPVLCRPLQSLFFLSCPIPSFDSIKKMIEQRNSEVDYDDPDWKTDTSFGPAIRNLEISRCWSTPDSPAWTQDERAWLSSKVANFTWT